MQRVIASRGVEDSVAVNIAVANGLLSCAIKGNGVSAVYINGVCLHITFAYKGIAESKKSEENLLESYLQESSLFLYWASFVE